MLRFKQFLLEYGLSDAFVGTNKAAEESKNMRNPLRKDYSDDDEGQQAYLGALKTSSEKQRKVGTEMTDTASGQANTLKNTETTLKAVKDVADTTLSVGAAVVPVVGTALNAAVKGIEGGLEAKDGNYVAAGIKVADAILPVAGKFAGSVTGVANVGKGLMNPVKTAIEVGAKKLGVNALATKAGGSVLGAVAPNLGTVGTNLASKAVSSIGIKQTANAVANTTSDVVQPLINSAKETGSEILASAPKNDNRYTGTTNKAKI
jgi:hypothetical protein